MHALRLYLLSASELGEELLCSCMFRLQLLVQGLDPLELSGEIGSGFGGEGESDGTH